jgi:hypothetical protein
LVRALDDPIPPEELLYRSVSAQDLVGNDILDSAVDLPRCSFNRAKYSQPGDVITVSRPKDNGILTLTSGELPGPVPRDTGEPYEFFTQDDPTDDNGAHAEVRMRRQGHPFNPNHKVNKTVLAKAKDQLVRKLRVYKAPEP